MKNKQILKLPPVHSGMKLAAQFDMPYLVFDVWKIDQNGDIPEGRYAVDINTGEYGYYDYASGIWHQRKLEVVLEGTGAYYGYSYGKKAGTYLTETDVQWCEDLLKCRNDVICYIDSLESSYCRDRRWEKEQRRCNRLNQLMAKIPAYPHDIQEWLYRCCGEDDYLFKENKQFFCTFCRSTWPEKEMKSKIGKVTHNVTVACPVCGKSLTVKTRQKRILKSTGCTLLQNIDPKMGVARHFDVVLEWNSAGRKVYMSESMRIILYRENQKKICDIYYNQYPAEGGWNRGSSFDRGNPANRRSKPGFCYPGQISVALKDTFYEPWTRTFEQMAAAGVEAQYNRMMANTSQAKINMSEYLFKGRFKRLLLETTERMEYGGGYWGILDPYGRNVTEVFRIKDRQMVNRIRDLDGGQDTVRWMRYSEKTQKKIDQETLEWLNTNGISPDDVPMIKTLSPRQVMNYVERQRTESYPERTACGVLGQWNDYLSMCKRLGKDLEDEMVYRPRELKRRHDEAAAEINRQMMIEQMKRDEKQRKEQAEKMRQKFPGAEEVLADIREKYEYSNAEYIIIVPQSLMDIVTEGQALHHCAGATDRYFDRIMQRETYICFLRKAADPDLPYYTIEVEPGGTIRQHRGYLDEEPEIEQIKPFLREWQKELKKRLSSKDHEYAQISAVKRQLNIEELKAKNNERVLRGLMEDFMEAV